MMHGILNIKKPITVDKYIDINIKDLLSTPRSYAMGTGDSMSNKATGL
jgi:hypothetical protein